MKEIFKEIPEFEGLYRVSNCGRVWSIGKDKELSQQVNDRGYMKVRLVKNGMGKNYQVHRLVLFTFMGQPPKDHICNHKDYNRANNNLDNLEWVTYSYNTAHSWQRNRLRESGEKNHKARLNSRQVLYIRDQISKGRYGTDVAKEFGISFVHAYDIFKRKVWKHLD